MSYDHIKKWDDIFCAQHVINLVNHISSLLLKNNINQINYLDIGANVGKVYDLLSERIPINKAYLVEASPLLFNYIKQKYTNNSKVQLFNFAAYNEETKECLWQEKHDSTFFESLKRQNPFYYYSQFQQQPIAGGNAIYRKEWFHYYDDLPELASIIQSWDTAFKKGSTNDYSVCTTWGVQRGQFGDVYYLIHMWRGKVEYPELKKKFLELQDLYKPNEILIEDKASGQSLIQDLKAAGNNRLVPIKVDSDKETRAHATTSIFDNGRVLFPEDEDFTSTLEGELLQFPNGNNDDCVDSVNQALIHLNKPRSQLRVIELW